MQLINFHNKTPSLLRAFLLLSLFLALPACSKGKPKLINNPQLVASPDRVDAMIADAADRAAVALETMAAVDVNYAPAVSVAPIPNAPTELNRALTLEWVGPVEPLIKSLADQAGYRFEVLGNAPASPVVVSVNVENTPLIEIMRSVGLQLGTRADVRVDSDARVVEVQYASNAANATLRGDQ
jgi:defect-in-organelle-trafficking protein DotD